MTAPTEARHALSDNDTEEMHWTHYLGLVLLTLGMCLSSAAITKCHRLGGSYTTEMYSSQPSSWKPKVTAPAGWKLVREMNCKEELV